MMHKSLTADDISRVMKHPDVLFREGYLKALNLVIPCLRADLTDVLLQCVDPDDDHFDVVLKLHTEMQKNNLFGEAVIATARSQEKLSAREFIKLIDHLANQSEHELGKFAKKGMKEIIRT